MTMEPAASPTEDVTASRSGRHGGQRHIPVRRRTLVKALAKTLPDRAEGFGAVAELLTALVHHEFHGRLEDLKDAFAPFDPDEDVRACPVEERTVAQRVLVSSLAELLDDANYEVVDRSELTRALDEETLLKVRLKANFDDFEEVLFYARGTETRTETVRTLGGLKREDVTFVSYSRVLIYVKVHEADHFTREAVDELPFEPGSTFIKLFKDVPRADLETLFPNTEVRMRPVDSVVIGVPAVVGGLAILVTKLLAALGAVLIVVAAWLGLRDDDPSVTTGQLVALGLGLGSLGGFVWRQVSKYQNRRLAFLKQLSEHLYLKNLDNGAGVLHHLIDAAEEEETKEVLAAYGLLLEVGEALTVEEIDRRAEGWFADRFGCDLDFDEADAVEKLTEFDLVTVEPSPEGDRYLAVEPSEAYRRLDERWDDYFTAP